MQLNNDPMAWHGRSEQVRQELPAALDQLPASGHQAWQVLAGGGADHPAPALRPGQQVVRHRHPPPRPHRQRDQKLLEHPPQEAPHPDGLRPHDAPPAHRLLRRAAAAHRARRTPPTPPARRPAAGRQAPVPAVPPPVRGHHHLLLRHRGAGSRSRRHLLLTAATDDHAA